MKRVVGATGALLIHAGLALLFIGLQPSGERPGGNASASVQVRLIPKTASSDIQSLPREGDRAGAQGQATEERICKDKDESYQGIGIMYAPFSMIILEAPESYPAYKAGLRQGDMILSYNDAVSGYLTYTVLRGKQQLTFQIKQEKICFEQN